MVILINEDYWWVLLGWLFEFCGEWCFLYCVIWDGFEVVNFYVNCDDKGFMVIIVKSGNNIFGGFIEMLW